MTGTAAENEARSLVALTRTGSATVADVLDLIAVRGRDKQRLRAFARTGPGACRLVNLSLSFRRAVLFEFNKLVRMRDVPESVHFAGGSPDGLAEVSAF